MGDPGQGGGDVHRQAAAILGEEQCLRRVAGKNVMDHDQKPGTARLFFLVSKCIVMDNNSTDY